MKLAKLIMKLVAVCACVFAAPARAGIPVFDGAAVAQAVQQVMAWQQQYQQMAEQLIQAKREIDSITGVRGFGDILNNPLLQNVVPQEIGQVYRAINQGGTAGLTSAAQAIRSAAQKYGCEGKTGEALTSCQAILNTNAQTQAYLQQALDAITQRSSQIDGLRAQINTTTDAKGIAELQARIAAENTQVTNDVNRVTTLAAMATANREAAEQAQRERWLKTMQTNTPSAASTFTYHQP